jgi:hypothetical protein
MGNSLGRIIIGVICVALVSGAARGLSGDINSELQSACVDINKDCPKQVDSITRFDGCVAGDKRITYNYTLTLPALNATEQANVMTTLKSQVSAELHSNSSTKSLLGRGVTMSYHYSDLKGKVLLDFDVVK